MSNQVSGSAIVAAELARCRRASVSPADRATATASSKTRTWAPMVGWVGASA
jgi:hypothetical protein